jgi:hypothetical protein
MVKINRISLELTHNALIPIAQTLVYKFYVANVITCKVSTVKLSLCLTN